MPESPVYLSIDSAADRLAVTPRTIRRFIASGQLAGYRVGPKLLRVRAAEVDALLRRIPSASISA